MGLTASSCNAVSARKAADFIKLGVGKVARDNGDGYRASSDPPALRKTRNQRPRTPPRTGSEDEDLYRRIPVYDLAYGVDRIIVADDQLGLHANPPLNLVGMTRGLEPGGIHRVLADIPIEAYPAAKPGVLGATENGQTGADSFRAHGGEDQRLQALLGLVGDRQEFS